MAEFDSIINVEEWLSDYYFTTDDKGESFGKRANGAVTDWKDEDKEHGKKLSRWAQLTGNRNALQTAFSRLSEDPGEEDLANVYGLIRRVFGYPEPEEHTFVHGDEESVLEAATDSGPSFAVLAAQPLSSHEDIFHAGLTHPATIDGKERDDLAVSDLISHLYLSETPPRFVVVLGGRWVILTERESWAARAVSCDRPGARRRTQQHQGPG